MSFFDLSLEELQQYHPNLPEPPDFDAFWAETLAEARQFPLNPTFTEVDYGLKTVKAYDVTFAGYGGHPIKGWLLLPAGTIQPLAGIMEFIGYGGGRATPLNWLGWASAGYAFMVMDTRGQGSSWQRGDTPDIADGGNPSYPGFMTQGILNPRHYYYRRLFCDTVRAIEAFQSHPLVDPERIAVTGGSQGGGMTIAATALSPSVKIAMPDVPFLCHFRRATEITDKAPYSEIASYLRVHRHQMDTVFNTLNYFDGVHFAKRIGARVLCSVALMDTICPPSTVFAAYNAIQSPKEMRVYTYNDHEGGGADHHWEKIKFVQAVW
jgi:cephalosporin-C deacetylase